MVSGRQHKYGFGGKEYNDELGLDWYDVSARNYDPALGRWMNIDPLAEDMRRHSPYNFGFDNPVYFQDYDGMMPTGGTDPVDGKKKKKKENIDQKVVGAIEAVGNFILNPVRGAIDFFSPKGGGDQPEQTVPNENIDRVNGQIILDANTKMDKLGKGPKAKGDGKTNGKYTSKKGEHGKELIDTFKEGGENTDKIITEWEEGREESMSTETTAGEKHTDTTTYTIDISLGKNGTTFNTTRTETRGRNNASEDSTHIANTKRANGMDVTDIVIKKKF